MGFRVADIERKLDPTFAITSKVTRLNLARHRPFWVNKRTPWEESNDLEQNEANTSCSHCRLKEENPIYCLGRELSFELPQTWSAPIHNSFSARRLFYKWFLRIIPQEL
jgi:hypothetical protein